MQVFAQAKKAEMVFNQLSLQACQMKEKGMTDTEIKSQIEALLIESYDTPSPTPTQRESAEKYAQMVVEMGNAYFGSTRGCNWGKARGGDRE